MELVPVLVVDDEPVILRLLDRVLSLWGAAVEATDGESALRLLSEREFALVISDTQMPVVDGYEVLKTARIACPKAIRVLMSGNPAALSGAACDDSPAHHLLNKPIDRVRLRQLFDLASLAATRIQDLVQLIARRYTESTDSVFVKDAKGRYLFMNAAGAMLLQRPAPEIIGRVDAEVIDQRTLLEEVRASDQEVLRTGNCYLYVNATRVPGSARLFLSVKFPVYHASGAMLAIGCLSRDVTELMKLAPAERTRLVDDLLRDLGEISSIFAGESNPVAIDRFEVEHCLKMSESVADRIVVVEGDDPRRQ
ncbi:MAG: response regulator [Planctomycetes bacterium]|nr:response regulator [Planctomycetota bacterium]